MHTHTITHAHSHTRTYTHIHTHMHSHTRAHTHSHAHTHTYNSCYGTTEDYMKDTFLYGLAFVNVKPFHYRQLEEVHWNVETQHKANEHRIAKQQFCNMEYSVNRQN